MYVCIDGCTCMYICMCVCMYVCMYVCVYVCLYVCMYVCIYMYTYFYIYVWYMYVLFVWKNVCICMNACGCKFFMHVYCICVYIWVYCCVCYVYTYNVSSDLLKKCALACGSRLSHNELSIFCFIYFTQSAKSRDNLDRLLVAELVRNNETLITGRTVWVINFKYAMKNWSTLQGEQQAYGTYHACLLFILQINLK